MSEFKHNENQTDLFHEADEVYAENSCDGEDIEFDLMVGALEDILFEGQLSNVQKEFCEKHCHIFEDTEENKLEYSEIFRQYTEIVEKALEVEMQARFPGFVMSKFESLLKGRDEIELCGDVFDILLSLSDFNEFKHYMLSVKRGTVDIGLSVETRRLIP